MVAAPRVAPGASRFARRIASGVRLGATKLKEALTNQAAISARGQPRGQVLAWHEGCTQLCPMNEAVVKRSPDAVPRNVGDVLEDALLQAKTLIQAEVSLARHELSSELKAAYGMIALLAVGAMALQAALVTLGVWVMLAFGVGVAALVVIAALTAAGCACALVALRGLGKTKLPDTRARLASDAKEVLETVK